MTAQEAKAKSDWYNLSQSIRERITIAVENGRKCLLLNDNEKLHIDDQYALQELGYYIYLNKAFDCHEIRW